MSPSPEPAGPAPSISEVATLPVASAEPSPRHGSTSTGASRRGNRQLTNWLTSYQEFANDIAAPASFHLWSGITAISGALSRRVWVRTNPRMPPLFPNLFTFLVARPGLGKDLAINTAAEFLREADRLARDSNGGVIRLGGESISHKGLYDKLGQEASRLHIKWTENGKHHDAHLHSLMFCIGELGTVMPEYDNKLIPLFNDLYNCKPFLEDTIRGQEVQVENPSLVLLLGNQPQTLHEVVSDRHFRMGFTSRVIFVYEDDECAADMYQVNQPPADDKLRKALVEDLMEVAKLSGPFRVSADVMQLANAFKRDKPQEVPGIRFVDYNTRRPLHMHKLALCLAAAEGTGRSIEVRHWEQALEILLATEARMPCIFDQVTSVRGFSEDLAEIERMVRKAPGPLPQTDIVEYLSRTRPPHEVTNIMRILKDNGTLVPAAAPDGRLMVPPSVVLGRGAGRAASPPSPRRPHP